MSSILREEVPDTSIAMLLLEKNFDINEYVNLVCLPSVSWIPVWTRCYITGRANFFLNYQFKTQIRYMGSFIKSYQIWSGIRKELHLI